MLGPFLALGVRHVLKDCERIDTLEQRLRELKMKQQRIEARRRSFESRRARREDTRRKILVGAIVLAKVEQGVLEDSVLRGWLDAALSPRTIARCSG